MPTPAEIRQELKSRGVQSWEAFRCCVRNRNQISRMMDEIADGLEFSPRVQNGQCALVKPGQTTFPRVDEVCIPKKQPMPQPGGDPRLIWIGIAVAAASVVAVELQSTPEALPQLVAALRKIATSVRTTTLDDCYQCVKKKQWGQSSPRKTFHGAEARDGTIERTLLLRKKRHGLK